MYTLQNEAPIIRRRQSKCMQCSMGGPPQDQSVCRMHARGHFYSSYAIHPSITTSDKIIYMCQFKEVRVLSKIAEIMLSVVDICWLSYAHPS
jgi:hypothetical protein